MKNLLLKFLAESISTKAPNLKFDFDFEFWGCKIENLPPKIEKSAPQNLKFDFDFEF